MKTWYNLKGKNLLLEEPFLSSREFTGYPIQKGGKYENGRDSSPEKVISLTLLHSERPKLYAILAFLSAIGLKKLKDS